MSGSAVYGKALMVIEAWRSRCPNKTFFRMSLEDFTNLVEHSREARDAVAALKVRKKQALADRNEADRTTRRAVLRIVNAVKGDPDEGEDGELLTAMGYLSHTTKSNIISRARRGASKAEKDAVDEAEEL